MLGDAHDVAGGSGAGQGGDSSEAGAPPGGAATGGDHSPPAGAAGDAPDASLGISPSALPGARLNQAYRAQFSAHGGVEPYSFSLVEGTLPAGLDLSSDGLLSGTPSVIGDFDLTLQVKAADDQIADAAYRLSVSRGRWLATQTFVSSASMQSLLSLTDLLDPQSEMLRIETESASGVQFSPDGRWLVYYAFRSSQEIDWYIVDTAAAAPERKFLLTNSVLGRCAWAPDSSKLACTKQGADPSVLVYFDTRGAALTPGVSLDVADRFVWVDADSLVYAVGAGAYSRITWSAGVPGAPQLVGLSGVKVERQSPGGERAIVTPDAADEPQSLVDLKTGESSPLPTDPVLNISDDFSVAVSVTPTEADPEIGTFELYSLSGVTWSLVGETTAKLHARFAPYTLPLVRNRLALVKGSQVSVAVIDETGFEELVVPGDFAEVRSLEQDSRGRWLYIETGERAPNQQFVPASIEHWLSRIEQEAPALLLETEFVGSGPAFSADGRHFSLHGYDSYSPEAVPFHLFDLGDPEQPKQATLDIPLNWAESTWSADSSFLSFLGGSPSLDARPLFVVDALAPATPPRTIVSCASNPAPLPGCPMVALFQP